MYPHRTAQRGRTLGLALVLTLFGSLLTTTSSFAANFTWSGGASGSEPKWSNTTNWEGGVAPSGSIGTLTFPALTSPGCTAVPPTTTCYASENDISGLSVNALSIDDGHFYRITGNGITLGAGGLTASTAAEGPQETPYINIPISLSATQKWSISGGSEFHGLYVVGPVTGAEAALELAFTNFGFLDVEGDIEVGPVEVKGGGVTLFGEFCCAPARLNATDGHPVTVKEGGSLNAGHAEVGSLSISGGTLATDPVNALPELLTVNGSAVLDSTSTYEAAISAPELGPEEQGYSQLKASGNVNLGGATLKLGGEEALDPGPGECPALEPGEVKTLVTTTGALTGAFKSVPDGTVLTLACHRGTKPTLRINYTEHTVTATVVTAGPVPKHPIAWSSPTLAGTAREGQTLTGGAARWIRKPTSFAYQWVRCAGEEEFPCKPIAGATQPTYTLTAADVGFIVRFTETASNAAGSRAATSEPTAVVQPGPSSIPINRGAPVVSGNASIGSRKSRRR